MTYEELVRAIGPGFHPDTSGDQYTSLPEGVTPELVDTKVWEAFVDSDYGFQPDPYTRGLEALGLGNPIDHEGLD